jgi:hypothetical protein
VGDQDESLSLPVQLLEELHDLPAGGRVEISRRLVREHEAGSIHQSPRDGDALALAPGELARTVPAAIRQAEIRHHRLGDGAPPSLRHPGVHQGQLDVLSAWQAAG